jgi:K+-sensing histidine kinase KdpD
VRDHEVGMGLSICRSIVEAHAGRIWYPPAEPGATVQFTLPSIRRPRARKRGPRAPLPPP